MSGVLYGTVLQLIVLTVRRRRHFQLRAARDCQAELTGAGDAFFGTLLACLDGKDFNEENLTIAMQKANQAGAKTTQFLGAVEL